MFGIDFQGQDLLQVSNSVFLIDSLAKKQMLVFLHVTRSSPNSLTPDLNVYQAATSHL